MDSDLKRISKFLSLVLRHKPWLYELELDTEGWISVETLLAAMRSRRAWENLDMATLEQAVLENDKQRFELRAGRIRARYGHSLPGRLTREPGQPPERLYHGTPRAVLPLILREGLRPMSRQYVHLSVSLDIAWEVAYRKDADPLMLEIRALEAQRTGLPFYMGNEFVWLADAIPPAFLSPLDLLAPPRHAD